MKKILFISPLPPPYYGSAISSKMCLEILKNSKKFKTKNVQLNYSKNMKDIGKISLDKIRGISRVSKQIKNNLKLFRPDSIYFVPATSGLGLIRDSYFVSQIRKEWKGKIIFHIRSRIPKEVWKNNIFKRICKKMLLNQVAIILGPPLKEDLHGLIEPKNIIVLPNAIRNEITENEFKKIIQKRKKQNSFNILFLSNMNEEKGWPKLLEACKILKNQNIKFKCNLVGEFNSEESKSKLKEFISKNNLEANIEYLGKKIGKEKNNILKESDILVFPTEYKLETFGRVIIEAMMFGLPVIANGIATIPNIIKHGETGFVLKNNSPKEIAYYITRLQDRELRQKMGESGRKRFIDKYEIREYSKKFVDILIDKI